MILNQDVQKSNEAAKGYATTVGKRLFSDAVSLKYVIQCYLTNSMQQRPSWEVVSSIAGQEIPCLLWNEQFHYYVHNSPP
jgi:hypothetical protein